LDKHALFVGASAMSVLRSMYLTDFTGAACLVEKLKTKLDSPKTVPSDFDFCRQFPNHDEFSGRFA